jgi:hypothetical protein
VVEPDAVTVSAVVVDVNAFFPHWILRDAILLQV